MLKLFLFSVFLSFVSAQAAQVTIASYNIRVPVDPAPNNWDQRKFRIASLINKYSPDIVGLQEVEYPTLKDLLGALGGKYCVSNAVVYDNAIIYKCEHKLLDTQTWALSDTPNVMYSNTWGLLYKRSVTYSLIDVRGKQIPMFNTHLDLIPAKVNQQETLIVNLIKSKDKLNTAIITGDFNTEDITVFAKNGFIDTYTQGGDRGTFGGFGRPSEAKIDFILSRCSVNTLEGSIIRDTIDGLYPSDHAMMLTKINV
jgi:endonuclease/exonuclease/phosphatase family metal-dependent hydrolase